MLKLSTDRGFIVLRLASNVGLFKNLCRGTLIITYISRPRNQSLRYLEKNCRRDRLRQRQNNLENVKGFRGQGVHNIFFCSTLSEFENFLLCERILINVTTCQNETSS
jgi:hypothetical protein